MNHNVAQNGEDDKVVQDRAQHVELVPLRGAVRVVEEIGGLLDRVVQELPVSEGALVGDGPQQASTSGVDCA